jgi:asparagine synthase (glutamine-hydrolysing)
MCGICGFVGDGNTGHLSAMTEALRHRGPDAEGIYHDPFTRVFLGHRRLSILDIEGGAQPMWNEDGQVGVVFNGEIYNHAELRQELVKAGHVFASDHSDTEVLVHGYEEWGPGLALRLNGMFAFAIYDRRQGTLFLARDRFGEKPLYYAATPDFFAFASELRALGEHPRVDTSIDPRAVQKLFAYGFIPAPVALWRGVKKLPAGGFLSVDVHSRRVIRGTYWSFHVEPSERVERMPEAELAEELRRLLEQAVRRRLISDVPLGIFLSGGIDSSAVLAFAARSLPAQNIKTFCIGFEEATFDESTYAREVAEAIGTDHSDDKLPRGRARDLLDEVLTRLDEPLGDPSILPSFVLANFARKRITVALSGDGGDELFAGYDPFKALDIARHYSAIVPGWLHSGVRRLVDLLPNSTANMSLDFKLRRTLRGLSYPMPLWNSVWLGPLEPRELNELLQQPVDVEDLYSEALDVWRGCISDDLVDRTLEFYTRLYLPNDILVKADRASMLNSLEVRAPFLDNDLVEFARRLPASMKCRGRQTKYLLKQALGTVVPETVIRRKKKGFGIPLAAWLRAWPNVGSSDVAAALPMHRDWVTTRWNEHRAGIKDHRLFLWSWLALEHHGKGASARRFLAA